MAWIKKRWKSSAGLTDKELFAQRLTRFRQILRHYGRFLDIISDMAEKQGGGFIHDQQYLQSRAETLFNIVKSALLDFIIIADKRHLSILDPLEGLEAQARETLSLRKEEKETGSGSDKTGISRSSLINTEPLAKALAATSVIFRNAGQVVCRGIVAGEVLNLRGGDDLTRITGKKIIVVPGIDVIGGVNRLSQVVDIASAILTDRSNMSGNTASMIRASRIPAIIGLGNITDRLATGDKITVDAEENAIYEGVISELIEYYRLQRNEAGEEFEYQVLRRFRRQVFPLTLSEVKEKLPHPDDVKTLHDLIHLAHEMAGDLIMELAGRKAAWEKVGGQRRSGSVWIEAFSRMGESSRSVNAIASPRMDSDAVSSTMLSAFQAGIREIEHKEKLAPVIENREVVLWDEVQKDTLNLIMPFPGEEGFDMIDATIAENQEDNFFYCRFASRLKRQGENWNRRDSAYRALSKLGFASAMTNRAVCAWFGRVGKKEAEARFLILGKIWRLLREKDLRKDSPSVPEPESMLS